MNIQALMTKNLKATLTYRIK